MALNSVVELYTAFLKCTDVAIDSRKVNTGDLFFALKGELVDGHKYAKAALDKGANFVVIDNPEYAINDKCLLVEDVLTSLQNLSTHHRQQFSIPVIAITGSNGKTTTKELLAEVLSRAYNCHYTQGNFNNHLGVPLTLLRMKKSAEVAVIEMGANHQGEIAALCEIAQPTHGIITNIGKAHLEGFGGIEGVKIGKGELYQYLSTNNGVGFINKEEQFLLDLSVDLQHRRVIYGCPELGNKHKWLRGNCQPGVDGKNKLTFWDEQGKEVISQSQLVGEYNCPNLITAATLGLYFKVPAPAIKEAIEHYIPQQNRSQLLEHNGVSYILDAYNANPTSMEVALQNLAKQEANYKVAILGAMKELGDYAANEHQRILELAQSFNFDVLFVVGEEFEEAAVDLGVPYYIDVQAFLTSNPTFPKGAMVLIKGSRSIGLEKIVSELT